MAKNLLTYGFLLTLLFNHSGLIAQAPNVDADFTEGCDSLTVNFSLQNVDTDTILSIIWDFGNGTFSNLINPMPVRYTSDRKETYDINVSINGVDDVIVRNNFITIHHTVHARFECLDTLTSIERINLVCQTIDRQYDPDANYSFSWQFEDFGSIGGSRPLISYPNQNDVKNASLTLTDLTNNCISSVLQQIYVQPEILIQNVFTPDNGDELNDNFQIHSLIPLQIKIYNRYGIMIYQAEGTEIIWDGTTVTGNEAATGVYFYILKALSNDPGNKYDRSGVVHLFR